MYLPGIMRRRNSKVGTRKSIPAVTSGISTGWRPPAGRCLDLREREIEGFLQLETSQLGSDFGIVRGVHQPRMSQERDIVVRDCKLHDFRIVLERCDLRVQ